MLKKISFVQINKIIIMLFCFILPIAPVFTSLVLILFVLFWLLEGKFKYRFSLLKTEKYRLWTIVPVIFYILHIIGMTYSSNINSGLNDLKIKLPLLLFPLVFAVMPKELFSKENITQYAASLIFGCLVFALYTTSLSLIEYNNSINKDLHIFFYSGLSHYTHPSYSSLFSSFAVFFCLYLIPKSSKAFKFLWIFLLLILTIYTLMLSSKAGYLSLFFCIIFGFYIIFQNSNKSKLIITFGIGIVFLSVIGLGLKNVSFIKARFSDVLPALRGETNSSSSAVRIQLWRSGSNMILENFWTGVGTGDIRDEFQKATQQYSPKLHTSYNPHNQFLQTFISLGIFGFINLCAFILFVPIYLCIKNKYPILMLFALLSLSNFFVESMIERQAGVMFFTFFYCLLIMASFQQKISAPATADRYE